MTDQPTAPGLRDQLTALEEKWRERAVAAIKAYGLYAASGAAFTKCADELASALREAATLTPQPEMCAEHAAKGGDPDCPNCFRENYEEIGRELMRKIRQQLPEYTYSNCPTEVVGDLLNRIEELEGEAASSTLTPAPSLDDVLLVFDRWRGALQDGAFSHRQGTTFVNDLRALFVAAEAPLLPSLSQERTTNEEDTRQSPSVPRGATGSPRSPLREGAE